MREREAVLRAVADRLIAARAEHPLRVGIDGPCGAGKTTFARELVGVLAERGADAVHLDSDGFHHQRAVRYRQGRDSARGYYEDAYDFDALAQRALRPLGPGGTLRYATQVHDMATDALVTDAWALAAAEAIVVFDGTFLQRGLLRELPRRHPRDRSGPWRGPRRRGAGRTRRGHGGPRPSLPRRLRPLPGRGASAGAGQHPHRPRRPGGPAHPPLVTGHSTAEK